MRGAFTVLALTVLALLAVAAPAQASLAGCHGKGGYEVCFNDVSPGTTAKDHTVLFRRLRALIGRARSGDEIRVAMYSWDTGGRKVTDALVRARKRGASVAVVADDEAEKAGQLAALRAGGVNVSVCLLACLSHAEDSIQHVKLFLLKLGGRKHVVVSTSNLTGRQRDVLSNDFVHSTADDDLYDYYEGYWGLLYTQFAPFFPNSSRVHRTPAGNTAMVFPRTDRDPVLRILRGVRRCKAPHNKVWVAAARWSRKSLRKRLIKLRSKYRCQVRLVIGPETRKAFARALPQRVTRYAPIHHKLLLIDATVGKGVRRVVYTGSHNWSYPALDRHDELWTGYTSPFVIDTYGTYFRALYARSARTR
jgi:phosphatidylserine/phosphatidylglycerophosphate/cardiolipin synthase-like enzyme